MTALPGVGTRVSVRYRRPAGSQPALTDAVGHLEAVDPVVRVRTRAGEVVEFAPADVVTIRRLTDVPVRNSQIRAVEHAAALGWPGVEQHWVDGWLLRAGRGSTRRANSAVPLQMYASVAAIPQIVDWYARRGLTARLALPDRLVAVGVDTAVECETRMFVADVDALPRRRDPSVELRPGPDENWLAGYGRDVPVDVLGAVVGGPVVFAAGAGGAVARAAVTEAPDGHRWVGIFEPRVAAESRRAGHATTVCAALLSWAADHGATRGYAQVNDGDDATQALLESLGFAAQHRCRFVSAEAVWAPPPARTV